MPPLSITITGQIVEDEDSDYSPELSVIEIVDDDDDDVDYLETRAVNPCPSRTAVKKTTATHTGRKTRQDSAKALSKHSQTSLSCNRTLQPRQNKKDDLPDPLSLPQFYPYVPGSGPPLAPISLLPEEGKDGVIVGNIIQLGAKGRVVSQYIVALPGKVDHITVNPTDIRQFVVTEQYEEWERKNMLIWHDAEQSKLSDHMRTSENSYIDGTVLMDQNEYDRAVRGENTERPSTEDKNERNQLKESQQQATNVRKRSSWQGEAEMLNQVVRQDIIIDGIRKKRNNQGALLNENPQLTLPESGNSGILPYKPAHFRPAELPANPVGSVLAPSFPRIRLSSNKALPVSHISPIALFTPRKSLSSQSPHRQDLLGHRNFQTIGIHNGYNPTSRDNQILSKAYPSPQIQQEEHEIVGPDPAKRIRILHPDEHAIFLIAREHEGMNNLDDVQYCSTSLLRGRKGSGLIGSLFNREYDSMGTDFDRLDTIAWLYERSRNYKQLQALPFKGAVFYWDNYLNVAKDELASAHSTRELARRIDKLTEDEQWNAITIWYKWLENQPFNLLELTEVEKEHLLMIGGLLKTSDSFINCVKASMLAQAHKDSQLCLEISV